MVTDTRHEGNGELTPEEEAELATFVDPDRAPIDPALNEGRGALTDEMMRSVVGGLMKDPWFVERTNGKLGPEHFVNHVHKLIVRFIFDYYSKYGHLPNRDELTERFERDIATMRLEHKQDFRTEFYLCLDYHYRHQERAYLLDEVTTVLQSKRVAEALKRFFVAAEKGRLEIGGLIEALGRANEITVDADENMGMTLEELFEYADQHQQEWLIPNWLPAASVVLFSGPPKKGKSTTIFSLIPALIKTGLWLDEIKTVRCPVMYVDLENHPDYVRANLLQYLSVEDAEGLVGMFDAVHPERVPVAVTEEWLLRYMEKRGLLEHEKGVVIVDSATPAFGSLFKESSNWDNNASDVRKAMRPLQNVARKTGWSIIVVHHDNKKGDVRGSGDWLGAVDYLWRFGVDGEHRTLRIEGRLLEEPDALFLAKDGAKLRLVGSRQEVKAQQQEDKRSGDVARLLELVPVLDGRDVDSTTGKTVAQLQHASGLGKTRVYEYLKAAHEDGRVSCKKLGKGATAPLVYWREKLLAG